jgi:hypothetical protein
MCVCACVCVSVCVCLCLCECVCVCLCLCECVCASICLGVSLHYKIKRSCIRNSGKIILNVPAYISPIRLRDIAGTLAGARVCVSGWGNTSNSKYNCLIILYFNLRNCTYLNDSFKEEAIHGLQHILWPL